MKKIDQLLENFFINYKFLAPWLLRLLLGTSFIIHGSQKFPLPAKNLIEWFNFSPFLATFVPIIEVSSGLLIILSGIFRNPLGNLLTRLSAFIIAVFMVFAFTIAHLDWFITTKLFTSEQIFLLGISIFFLIKGKD
jgi:uncharacterized membrane protein YphA (DoxX/SURF4 family)